MHGCGPQSMEHMLALRPEAVLSYAHERHPGVAGPPWRFGIFGAGLMARVALNGRGFIVTQMISLTSPKAIRLSADGSWCIPVRPRPHGAGRPAVAAVAAAPDADGAVRLRSPVRRMNAVSPWVLRAGRAGSAGVRPSCTSFDLLGLVALVADCPVPVGVREHRRRFTWRRPPTPRAASAVRPDAAEPMGPPLRQQPGAVARPSRRSPRLRPDTRGYFC